MRLLFIFALLLVLSPPLAMAQNSKSSAAPANGNTAGPAKKAAVTVPPEKAKPVVIPRLTKPPVIDGKLDPQEWKEAIELKDFYQFNPGDNIAPTKPTKAYLGYDSKFFYLAVYCYDEPDKVQATVARRDGVFDEDNVRLFLDTFNDQRKAYVLGWNPFGIQQDGIETEGQGTDFSVDIVMESKGMMTTDGWTLEVAIPFKSLRYVAGKDKQWGFHLWRNISRNNDEMDSWVPISRDINGTLIQAAHLTGLEGISTERTLEVIPSVTVSETGRRVNALTPAQLASNLFAQDPGRILNEPIGADVGVTVKYGLTPTITLDLAVNPDFAQVEADQTVVTANQRFPIFFEEKRPFFLEGIDIFRTSMSVVHTRAIVDPDVAMKITGKRNRTTFGLLVASDNAPGNFTEDEINDPSNFRVIERFVNKNAYVGVLRLKRDVGKESTIGFIGTTYNFIEKHNQVGGIDGRFKLDKQTILSFQVVGTTSRACFSDPFANLYSPAPADPCYTGGETRSSYRTGNGFAYTGNYNRSTRHTFFGINANGTTRDYRADVGFTRRTNTNNVGVNFGYNSEPKPKNTLVDWNVFNSTRTSFNWQGLGYNTENEASVGFRFQKNTYLGMGAVVGYERIFEEEFGVARTATQSGSFFGAAERSANFVAPYIYGGTHPSKKYSLNFFLLRSTGSFDFDFGAEPKYPRVSPAALVDPNAPLDPGPGRSWDFNGGIDYQPTNELSTSFGYTLSRLVRKDTELVAFHENIFTFRSTYQFTRFIFARARIDYATLASSARGQFLFGWTPSPGTAFYVGYNDDLTHNGYSPFTGQLEPGFRRNGRTFFIKVSYLIRKSFGG